LANAGITAGQRMPARIGSGYTNRLSPAPTHFSLEHAVVKPAHRTTPRGLRLLGATVGALLLGAGSPPVSAQASNCATRLEEHPI